MNLKITKDKRRNKTYLSIIHGYRDKYGKTKHQHIESLGSIESLKEKYEDPISHFKQVVAEMEKKRKEENEPITIKLDRTERIDKDNIIHKNIGAFALSKIYHELEINKFILSKFANSRISHNKVNNVMKLLVFGRVLFPSSKKHTYENKDMLFDNTDFSLKDVYRFLGYIEPKKDELQKYMYDHMQEQYDKKKKNTECVYYDVTNYYFEIDENDELRKKGVSKEHRPDPIVQMGLFQDMVGLPMCYKLFEGNTNDCLTLRPMVQELQKHYDIGKVIVVADKGLNTGNNIAYNLAIGNGYVMSQSVRGANKELKEFVLKEDGYTFNKDKTYKVKSRQYPREITITKKDGTKVTKRIDEKQVIFWSEDYMKKAKKDRQPAIDKAKELIGNVAKFNKANSYGASKYVKHLVFDSKTGEIVKAKSKLSIDEDKIAEEEKYDGYYAIVTSEYQKTDDEIVDIYRGLWKIEETFKITKSELDARPAFVSRRDHIEAHFLTCYISLVLARILQHKLAHEQKKYSVGQIIESLQKCTCDHVVANYYFCNYIDDVLEDIGNILNIDFSKKFITLKDIKKNLLNTKN